MPNHSAPKTVKEVIEILQAGFDEENLDPGNLTHKELDEELLHQGIDIKPALGRIQNLIEELRSNLPTKSLSPLEALYQRCRRVVQSPLRDDILLMVQSLKHDKVPQAALYAATLDPHNDESVKQFRENLAGLNNPPT